MHYEVSDVLKQRHLTGLKREKHLPDDVVAYPTEVRSKVDPIPCSPRPSFWLHDSYWRVQ